ncbi:head GIN domain-containing protein [Sphingomonas sp.]|uniref:head GIN domain-containing protein n=1 Tax=Sphingomonas sp. TaxID=28214 RepID=UPI001EC12A4C|nr:head GIN domain-containing protein [Sphingomonas sp.]MBX3594786.1 DUF2807 domain-containing protein [Sphingomonas sp.]
MKIALLAAMLPLAACNYASGMSGEIVEASGSGSTRSYQVAGFTGVSLRGSDNVEVRAGPFAVTAEGDATLLDRLEIRKDGDTLRIGRKSDSWNWGKGQHAKVIVTLPRLVSASVAGSGDMNVARAQGDLDASIAGSGNLRIAEYRGGKADLSIAGSGDLAIAGLASVVDISIAGSGDVDAPNLKAEKSDISIAGSGNVRAQVTGTADISIVGSGDAVLTGGAKCSVSAMGSGKARCS